MSFNFQAVSIGLFFTFSSKKNVDRTKIQTTSFLSFGLLGELSITYLKFDFYHLNP